MYIISTGLTRRRSAADLGATLSFRRLLNRPVTLGDPLGTPWGPLGDPLGIPWGSLGDPWGPLGDPWGILGDPLGKAWGPSGMSWDLLGTPWRALWDHLEVLLDTLGVSWGFFRGNLELQGASLRFQRVPRRALGGILGALWRLRKGLRSNSLQYAKTFKFIVKYCKNRGPQS